MKTMKTIILAATAALSLGASATNAETATGSDLIRNTELRFSTVGSDTSDLGDNWSVGAVVDVIEYDLGAGVTTVSVYGGFGESNDVDASAVGAMYAWDVAVAGRADLALTADAGYFMTDGLDNGNWIVATTANLSTDVNDTLAVFGEVGYTWNASTDWSKNGGYTELGVEFAVTDTVTLVPSMVKPFDSVNDDVLGAVEVRFNF